MKQKRGYTLAIVRVTIFIFHQINNSYPTISCESDSEYVREYVCSYDMDKIDNQKCKCLVYEKSIVKKTIPLYNIMNENIATTSYLPNL